MVLVVTILIGVGIGSLVELLLPGHTVAEWLLAIFLGAAGALLARFVGEWFGWFEPHEGASFVAAALGAIIILLAYGLLFRRNFRRRESRAIRAKP